jgi:hypothetical protein
VLLCGGGGLEVGLEVLHFLGEDGMGILKISDQLVLHFVSGGRGVAARLVGLFVGGGMGIHFLNFTHFVFECIDGFVQLTDFLFISVNFLIMCFLLFLQLRLKKFMLQFQLLVKLVFLIL